MTIVQNPWPFSHLLTDEVKSSRPATANIPRTLAGNAALAQGMTIGGNLVDGAPSLAPLMGHGYRGHDHSGGAGGAPLFRDVVTVPLGGGATSAAGEFTPVGGYVWGPTTAQGGGVTSALTTATLLPRPRLWIPPCAQDGAYHELYLRVTARLSASTGTLLSGDSVVIIALNLHPEMQAESNRADIVVTGGAGTRSAISETPMRFLPGVPNPLRFILRFETAVGGGDRAPVFSWWSISAGILSL